MDTVHDLAAVPKEPYPLLDQFEWCVIDLHDATQIDEVFNTFVHGVDLSFLSSSSINSYMRIMSKMKMECSDLTIQKSS